MSNGIIETIIRGTNYLTVYLDGAAVSVPMKCFTKGDLENFAERESIISTVVDDSYGLYCGLEDDGSYLFYLENHAEQSVSCRMGTHGYETLRTIMCREQIRRLYD